MVLSCLGGSVLIFDRLIWCAIVVSLLFGLVFVVFVGLGMCHALVGVVGIRLGILGDQISQ